MHALILCILAYLLDLDGQARLLAVVGQVGGFFSLLFVK